MISHRNLAYRTQDGEEVNLTDFQGQRVLVYFYPKAMTPGCTVQACGLRDNMDDLKKAGVEVLGISTDKPEKLSRFAEKELLNFTLLSDENHQVCEQFGVWGEKSFMGKPTTVFTVLVSSSMPMAKSNTSLMTSRPAITTTWC
ncbi:thiol peroxidase [Klebsiella variicola]|uniref:thioredoxin-dependent peroxiredoxin n=1 Tax=Klebsiella variicola TaxID=244366 RepID=A0A7H4MQ70_KLEVA|nr:thiol peroxidase [Klebsiella variicola]